jgi:hypothetical protein
VRTSLQAALARADHESCIVGCTRRSCDFKGQCPVWVRNHPFGTPQLVAEQTRQSYVTSRAEGGKGHELGPGLFKPAGAGVASVAAMPDTEMQP